MKSELEQLKDFQTLYTRNVLKLVQFAFLYIRDWEEAEDIVQEVFAQLWEKRSELPASEPAKAFLYLSVKSRSLNHLRHQRVVGLYLEQAARTDYPDAPFAAEEEYSQLLNLLHQLPDRRRCILELLYFQAWTYREVAQYLQLPLNTVKDHVKKTYAFLRREMVRY